MTTTRPNDSLSQLSAAEMSTGFANGEISPVEVARSVFTLMEAWEPKINAMYLIQQESALASAAASEQRWRAGKPLSPIDGVPVTIKENIYTKGDPAPIGCAANPLTPKEADAPPSARGARGGLL